MDVTTVEEACKVAGVTFHGWVKIPGSHVTLRLEKGGVEGLLTIPFDSFSIMDAEFLTVRINNLFGTVMVN